MIKYREEWLCPLICQYRGSVAVGATLYGLFASAVCIVLHVFHDQVEDFMKESGIGDIVASQTWAASTAMLLIILAIRTQQAWSRFWEGTSLLHQMRGEWFDAVSCLVSFSNGALEARPQEVATFRHTIVRLMSLCHGSALEEIGDSDNPDHLIAIDTLGLDLGTLRHLKECKKEFHFNRVELLLHFFQSLITKAAADGVLPVAAPILSRVYQTLSRGFVNLLNAKKISDTRFPFPFAQLIAQLLFLHLFLTPVMMASLIRGSKLFAAICSFVPVFGTFSLNFVARQLEHPFGHDDNDLPLFHFQTEMNSSLLMLLHDKADHVSQPSPQCVRDFQILKTVGVASRRHSLCSMDASIEDSMEFPLVAPRARSEAPVLLPATRAALEELEPKIELLAKRVEEFGLSLPQWAQAIQAQVLELDRSVSALQGLADSDQVEPRGYLNNAPAVPLQCFPTL
mmetsp:Transcript_26328/g.71547  ORF Transcript_26328/g.71547 Transcript_26328/m.71547 type:complete len:455 (-) Transcript_26328:91-1455(-)